MAEVEKDKTNALPYRTTREKFEKAIQVLRQSQAIEALDLAVGKFDRPFIVRSLGMLGLVDPQSLQLSDQGLKIAYATGPERQKAVLRALLNYPPYKIALVEAAGRKLESISVADIAAIWGEKKVGGSDSAREAGALVLAGLMESAGLGKFYVGRRGSVSRVDLEVDLEERIVHGLSGQGSPERGAQDDRTSTTTLKPQPAPERAPETPGFVRHNYQLRRGMVIQLELPEDLTAKEVERLAKWLATLPLEEVEE